MATNIEVAALLFEKLKAEQVLYQQDAVALIEQVFGDDYIYVNRNGNVSIKKSVLTAFRTLTNDIVVWISTERYWRFRAENDGTLRRQNV